MLVGYELFLFFKNTKLSRCKQIMVSALVFLVGLGLRYFLTLHAFTIFGDGGTDHFMVLECSAAYISCSGTLMLCYTVFSSLKGNRILSYIGEMTFYVYACHGMMLRYFGTIGDRLREVFHYGATGVQSITYYISYGVVIFFTSFCDILFLIPVHSSIQLCTVVIWP